MSVWKYQTAAGTRWQFKFEHRGHRIKRGGFLTKAEAETFEKTARQEAQREAWDAIDSTRRRDPAPWPKLSTLTAAYLTSPRRPARAERNVQALQNICRQTGRDFAKLTIADLNPAFVSAWFDHISQQSRDLDQAKANSRQTTANSLLTAALSIVSDQARDHYHQQGHRLPDLLPLLTAAKTRRFKLARQEYHPPDEQTIAATLDDWQRIDQDRNLFHAIGLALTCGLRKEEITQARAAHFTTRDHYAIYHAHHDVKSGTGEILTKCLAPYYHHLRTISTRRNWWPAHGGLLLTGPKTEREDLVYRRLSKFLTAHGWQMKKKAHALRDFAISCVAVKHGIFEASQFARHADVSTTQKHYNSFVTMWSFRDKADLPWDWSKADQSPLLKVVNQPG